MPKYFVLDTNVLLHDARSLFAFGDNCVVIPIEVLEELDKFKGRNNELGRNAREVVRTLDQLRQKGSLSEGVSLNGSGGRLVVDMLNTVPGGAGLAHDTPDNRILGTAWRLKVENKQAIFVTKDINLRIKSDAFGITTRDFEKEKVSLERLFTGWREITVDAEALRAFDADGELEVEVDLYPNEYALLRAEGDSRRRVLARRRRGRAPIVEPLPPLEKVYGVKPRNLEQHMALDMLFDDAIPLVTLVGKAGTGKTLLALAAGLQKTIREGVYEKILVSRPIMPLGRDIGYLPGSKDEKLAQWMQPIFDNLTFLLRARHHMGGDSHKRVADLIRTGIIEMEAITYIRGRSIYNQYLIVDEAQNLTPHEVKTIISRAGEETKLVLTGDPQQIDNPYLDAASNGLSYVAHAMRNQVVSGHCLLSKSERSTLASIAADVL